jgi:hypothetical protein
LAATKRNNRRLQLQGKERIAVGKALGHYKMAKHFSYRIRSSGFTFERGQAGMEREAALDGIYVIRTAVPTASASSEQTVRHYKELSKLARVFRSLKSVDLKIRPIHHHLEERVCAHVFLCMLAYNVEWHMRQARATVLFDDREPAAGETLRSSIVAPAKRSAAAEDKAQSKCTADGMPVHSFRTLLQDLRTIAINTVQMGEETCQMVTVPTSVQQRAFDLLRVPCRA